MAELYRWRYFEDRSAGQIEDQLRTSRISPFIARRLPQADDGILIDYARLYADQCASLETRDPAACFTFATKGGDARLVSLLGAELRQRACPDQSRAARRGFTPAAFTGDRAGGHCRGPRGVIRAVRRADGDSPGRSREGAPPADGLFCRVAITRVRAIAALPARQAGELVSSLFGAAQPASR
jgi:hypothetical protein